MRKFLLVASLMVGMCAAGAYANYTATVGSGTNFLSADVGGVKAAGFVSYGSNQVENLGTTADAACANSGSTCSLIAGIKGLLAGVQGPIPTQAASVIIGGVGVPSWGGGTLGAMANYGTSPGAVLVPGVNAFMTNANANGQATAANSSPVVSPVLTNAGAAVVKGGTAVVNGGSFYQAVAASQTATVLQTSTGATGDYLSHCVIFPTSTTPGVVTVFDNTNAAAGSTVLFPGGASSVSNLAPIPVPVGAVSTAGAWKVTTGANVSVVCYGKFS